MPKYSMSIEVRSPERLSLVSAKERMEDLLRNHGYEAEIESIVEDNEDETPAE